MLDKRANITSWRKENLVKKWSRENLISTYASMEQNQYLTLHLKIYLQWIKSLILRAETIKLLEETKRNTVEGIVLGRFNKNMLETHAIKGNK